MREELPPPPGWAYEPKWDGFRALAWNGPSRRLDSRNRRPLLRYFPELEPDLAELPPGTVVDGEVVVVVDERTDFDALQNRIHPASSRIHKLAAEIPASLVAFDLLALEGEDLRPAPFTERRAALEELAARLGGGWHLSPSTGDAQLARRWFDDYEPAGCDGLVAKRADGPYREGERDMVKVKHRRDADVVVGGYRMHKEGGRVGSLLLGMYDQEGELHFVGHCSGFADQDRVALLELLEPLTAEDSFGEEARRPGEPSRWSGGKDLSWVAVEPRLVCEVSYDQVTGARFRHAARFERWRPDKDPGECTLDQLERPAGVGFSEVVG